MVGTGWNPPYTDNMKVRTVLWLGALVSAFALVYALTKAGCRRARPVHQDLLLDEALDETFPASDPVSVFLA